MRIRFSTGLVLFLALAYGASSFGSEPRLPTSDAWVPTESRTENDMKLTLRVREVLAQDEKLRRLNLGVQVQNRIATLWGPVPSAEAARQVEERAQQIAGLAAVHCDLRIEPAGPAWGNQRSLPLLRRPTEAAALPPQPAPKERPEIRPPTSTADRPTAKVHASTAMVNPPSLNPTARSVLPEHGEWSPSRPPVTLAAPVSANPAPQHMGLTEAVDRLRLADARFRHLRSEVQGDAVFLRGSIGRWEDLFELARRIARLPGVERVVLDGIQSP